MQKQLLAYQRGFYEAEQKASPADLGEKEQKQQAMAFPCPLWFGVVQRARLGACVADVLIVERYGYLPGLFGARMPVAW